MFEFLATPLYMILGFSLELVPAFLAMYPIVVFGVFLARKKRAAEYQENAEQISTVALFLPSVVLGIHLIFFRMMFWCLPHPPPSMGIAIRTMYAAIPGGFVGIGCGWWWLKGTLRNRMSVWSSLLFGVLSVGFVVLMYPYYLSMPELLQGLREWGALLSWGGVLLIVVILLSSLIDVLARITLLRRILTLLFLCLLCVYVNTAIIHRIHIDDSEDIFLVLRPFHGIPPWYYLVSGENPRLSRHEPHRLIDGKSPHAWPLWWTNDTYIVLLSCSTIREQPLWISGYEMGFPFMIFSGILLAFSLTKRTKTGNAERTRYNRRDA